MRNIDLIIDNNPKTVQVERYFQLRGNCYLIYSMDGPDIDGNVRINVVKIKDHHEVLPIEMNDEWEEVKQTIVGIVNDNRECSKLSIKDLDISALQNITVTDAKALRLPAAVMPYLSANQPVFNSLELTEKALDDKTESLKEMNEDLTNLMDSVGKEFGATETITQYEPENNSSVNVETSTQDDKMEATMEIIMPTKQALADENVKVADSKSKGHFNLKNLFGKKKEKKSEDEEVEVEKNTEVTPTVVETDTPDFNAVETELSSMDQPVAIEKEFTIGVPPMDQKNIAEDIQLDYADLHIDNISNKQIEFQDQTPVNTFEEEMVEKPASALEPNGFEFFDTIPSPVMPEPIVLEEKQPETVIDTDRSILPELEVLELEEDVYYKNKYEEELQKTAALEKKVAELEQTIQNYQTKLLEIKDIVG